jgi:hypothetical protein
MQGLFLPLNTPKVATLASCSKSEAASKVNKNDPSHAPWCISKKHSSLLTVLFINFLKRRGGLVEWLQW